MTNDNTQKNLTTKTKKDDAVITSSAEPADAVAEKIVEKVVEKKSGSKGLTFFAILLALMGLGGSGYPELEIQSQIFKNNKTTWLLKSN